MLKVLIVTTSHDKLGDTGQLTGVWLEELAAPYYRFLDAGAEVKIASIRGGRIPIDPRSVSAAGTAVPRFLDDSRAIAIAEATPSVDEIDATAYGAIFLPGGHGAMWDLPQSRSLARALGTAFDAGRIVAAVCHGVAGFVSAQQRNGRSIVDGKRVNSFTNAEEEAEGLTATVPFLLETRLRELGGRFEKAPNFQPFAIRDENLITGQNPAASEGVAKLVLLALEERTRSSR